MAYSRLPSDSELVIIPTKELIERLRQQLMKLEDTEPSENRIIDEIISAIMYENKAMDELESLVADLVSETLSSYTGERTDGIYTQDAVYMGKIMMMFGKALHAELQKHKLYTNGVLFFQRDSITQADLVLRKLVAFV